MKMGWMGERRRAEEPRCKNTSEFSALRIDILDLTETLGLDLNSLVCVPFVKSRLYGCSKM